MDKPVDIWSFVVRVKSIALNVEFGLCNSKLIYHKSFRIRGIVIVGQELIEETTVYATIWTGDDVKVQEMHNRRVLGSASISKDVAVVRTFSSKDPLQIAGIDIHISLLQSEFCEFQNNLALADASQMTFSFDCVGSSLVKPRSLATPELILQNANVDISIIHFSVNFGM